jgi:hypothetical protein
MVLRNSWSVGLWISEGFFDKNIFIPSIFSSQVGLVVFAERKPYVSFARAFFFDRGMTVLSGVFVICGQVIMFVKGAEVEVDEIKSLSSTSSEITRAAKLGETMCRLVRKYQENFKTIGFKYIFPFPFWKFSPSCVDGCLFWDGSCV